jgi:micrococcal nuclease
MTAHPLLSLFFFLQVSAADVRVVDGDTVDVGPVRYRLADVDAPELNGRCLAERRLAALARDRVRALVAGARSIDIEPTGEINEARGPYRERLVARVRIAGADVGETLIREGLAQPWRGRRSWC